MADATAMTALKLQFYDSLVCDPSMRDVDARVAWRLLSYYNPAFGCAWPSIDTLAADLHKHPDTIKRAVRNLRDQGWFYVPGNNGGRWFEGRGRANEYTPNWERTTRGASVPHKGCSDADKGCSDAVQGVQQYTPNPSINPYNEPSDANPSMARACARAAGAAPDRSGWFSEGAHPERQPEAEAPEAARQGSEARTDSGADQQPSMHDRIAKQLERLGCNWADAIGDADTLIEQHGTGAMRHLSSLMAQGKRGVHLQAAIHGKSVNEFRDQPAKPADDEVDHGAALQPTPERSTPRDEAAEEKASRAIHTAFQTLVSELGGDTAMQVLDEDMWERALQKERTAPGIGQSQLLREAKRAADAKASEGGGMTMPAAERLQILADQLRRLSPDRRDPERYHLDKSEIERELRQVAREVSRAGQ